MDHEPMEGGWSPWQRTLTILPHPSVNHSAPPDTSEQFHVVLLITSLNNCRQQLEDQSGKVSQYTVKDAGSLHS